MKKIFLLVMSFGYLYGYTPMYLQPHDCFATKQQNSHSMHGSQEPKMFQLIGIKNTKDINASFVLPNLDSKKLKAEENFITLTKSPFGNYHAIVVNTEQNNTAFSAIRYIPMQGKPSKLSPLKITNYQKSALEIQPILLPREHDRYTSLKTYDFILKFINSPVPNQIVYFQTDDNKSSQMMTDANGKFSITFPDNFENITQKKRGNKPKEFVVHSTFKDGSKSYITSLSGEYHINPTSHWQSIPYGVLITFIGFLIGMLIYFKRVKNG